MAFTLTEIVAISLIITGVAFSIYWGDFHHGTQKKQLVITKESPEWRKPVQSNFDVYFYNWTNPIQLESVDGRLIEKPILRQIGPYRFREIREKVRIKWFDQNSTVSYRERRTYRFVPNESKGSLDDTIVTLDVPAIAAAYATESYADQRRVSYQLSDNNHNVFVVKTARELLFDGYQHFLDETSDSFGLSSSQFGWLYSRSQNDGIGDQFNVHTGKSDIQELGVVKKWNFQSETKFSDGECNKVGGSGGDYFPPDQTKEDPITLFNSDLRRPLQLSFTEEQEVNGLTVFKYSVADGVPHYRNMSSCYGVPLFTSLPYYNAAIPTYIYNYTDVWSPSRDDQSFYVLLEPKSGIPVEIVTRIQFNILIQKYEDIALYQDALTMLFPAIWIEQKVRISNERLAELMPLSQWTLLIGYIGGFVTILTGALLIIVLSYRRMKNPEESKEEKITNIIETPNGQFIGIKI